MNIGDYVQFNVGSGFYAYMIGQIKEVIVLPSGNVEVKVSVDYPYPCETPMLDKITEHTTLATSLRVISVTEFATIHEQAVRNHAERQRFMEGRN